ncbi:hypothetical protein GN958_ATG19027 [Phytophthora infestans]|uniref:Uncharacterized protein n=1 Tax=Phytophthora infestans TaxID=4787 RepID=A0A8S9TTD2_PHYIN|nr:hypothetical protein GN958_ATG19027 [Phytophthora infestans]
MCTSNQVILEFPVYLLPPSKSASKGSTMDSPVATAELSYESGKTLMAKGPQVLHDVMATKIPAATGRPLPEMEVRFSNLSLSADIVVADDHATKYELPTIPNELKKTLMGPKKLTVRKEILKNVSGRFAPGKITF